MADRRFRPRQQLPRQLAVSTVSFRGDPTVSAPRHPDKLPDGTIDRRSGEQGGLRRAEDWLGGGLLEFSHIPEHTFSNPTIADHFDALHQYIDNLGPGSSALVVNGWHAHDFHTGDRLYHADGSPVTDGSHATAIVYPEGASHPVWWDPQQGITSNHPPAWMVDDSSYLHFTPIEPAEEYTMVELETREQALAYLAQMSPTETFQVRQIRRDGWRRKS